VFNVNLGGCSAVYQLDLVAASGRGDLAIFEINYQCPWNKSLSRLRCHPYLQWSDSTDYIKGRPAFLFDHEASPDPSVIVPGVGIPANPVRSVSEVTVAENRYADPTGQVLYEGVAVGPAVLLTHLGSPIITENGTVIGLVSTSISGDSGNLDATTLIGPSQNFLTKVIAELLAGCDSGYVYKDGNINRYLMSFPGVTTSGVTTSPPAVAGLYHSFSVDDLILAPGGPLISSCYKAIQGIVLNYGTTTGTPYVPTTVDGTVFPFSKGDIIFGIDCCILGSLPPSQVSWATANSVPPGTPIKTTYLLASEGYSTSHSACIVWPAVPLDADLPSPLTAAPI
jgi:hypothetical protein